MILELKESNLYLNRQGKIMIAENYYLGAYWGNRNEDYEQCVSRVKNFLQELGRVDDIFMKWFLRGGSRKEALSKQLSLDDAVIRELLEGGRNKTDIGDKIIENLGYQIGLWNGQPEERDGVGLSIHCGMHSTKTNLFNCIVMNLPSDGESFEKVVSSEVFTDLVKIVVNCWEPDWAVATPTSIRKRKEVSKGSPYYGWILYLDKRRGKVPDLPFPAKKEVIGDYGTVIICLEERLDVKKQEHMDSITKTYKILQKNHLLGPIQ